MKWLVVVGINPLVVGDAVTIIGAMKTKKG